jgi:cytochrome bd-type quinol oxidase subunit 1
MGSLLTEQQKYKLAAVPNIAFAGHSTADKEYLYVFDKNTAYWNRVHIPNHTTYLTTEFLAAEPLLNCHKVVSRPRNQHFLEPKCSFSSS